VLGNLVAAAHCEGASLQVLDPAMTRSALSLTAEADRAWREDPAYRVELGQWTGGPADRTDGVPMHAWGPRDHDDHLHLRDFGAPHRDHGRADAVFEDAPTLAVLATRPTGLPTVCAPGRACTVCCSRQRWKACRPRCWARRSSGRGCGGCCATRYGGWESRRC
jgi:hypothetical protein